MNSLKKARLSNGLTQVQLSEIASVTQCTISNLESGYMFPRPFMRAKLDSILGPVDWQAMRKSYLEKELESIT